MFSDHDETSPLIAAVSAPSVARFILAVQQQKKNKNREKGVKKVPTSFDNIRQNKYLTVTTTETLVITYLQRMHLMFFWFHFMSRAVAAK